MLIIYRFKGLDTTTSRLQSQHRRKQIHKIHKSETKQLRILLGVCILFVICHTCRIVRHFEDLYLRFIGKDVEVIEPCSEGCASPMSLLSHVSFYSVYAK